VPGRRRALPSAPERALSPTPPPAFGARVKVNWSRTRRTCLVRVLFGEVCGPVSTHAPGIRLEDVRFEFDGDAFSGVNPQPDYAWACGSYQGRAAQPKNARRVRLVKPSGIFLADGQVITSAPWCWCGADGPRFLVLVPSP
jgi:hypothetical protein